MRSVSALAGGIVACTLLAPLAPVIGRAAAQPAPPGCRGGRVALVIGNKSYPDSDAPLKGTIEGARRVAEALGTVGFDVQLGEDLTKAKADEALRIFESKIKPGTAAFLYFSGFGVQAAGHTFLLPIDASIWSESDIANNGFNIDRILAELEDRKAAVEVLVVDAARRNPYERRFRAAGSNGLAPPSAGSGSLVALFSAAPDKVYDPRDLAADTFADDIAREITAPHATAQEAFRQVRAMVARTSRAGQTPWGFTTLSDDLPLDARDCSAAKPATAQLEPAAPARSQPATPATAPAPPSEPTVACWEGGGAAPTPPPEPSATPSANPAAAPPAAVPAAPAAPVADRPPEQGSQARRFQIALQDNNLLDETRERLFEQGFDPGPTGSDAMRSAINAFEEKVGLPPSGRATLGLLDALRAARSLGPWGAITVSADIKSWGMSWDQPTRSRALADAKSKCGSDKCTQAMSFNGRSCGAFALSPKRWNVTHRDGGETARKAALTDCGQTGTACRVIGSVCADGSDMTN